MERTADRTWGLGGWLLAAAALPMLLTLLVVLLMQAGAEDRVQRELQDRAALVAGALAEASEYALISGNAAALDRSVRELLARDRAIAAIDVLDAARRPFVSLPGPVAAAGEPSVELPVRSSVPDIDFFDRATPHVSLAQDLQPTFRLGPVAGYVRVTMSTEPLRLEQRRQLGLQLAVVMVTGLIGVLAVAVLARRIRASVLGLQDALVDLRQGHYDFAERPTVGSELRRLQGSVHELADSLAAASSHAQASSPPSPPHATSNEVIGRRLMGRLDAALVAVRLSAQQAARLADSTAPAADRQAAAQTAARILALADQAEAAGEALLQSTRPGIVYALGLDAALAELLRACTQAQPTCVFSLHQEPGFACQDAAQAVEVYRAVQAALSLVLARAQASRASVHLHATTASGEVRVAVADNAVGKASDGASQRLARLGEELSALGGHLDVQESPAGGTTLVLTLPPAAPSEAVSATD